jgi:hypothetical protein
MKKYSILSVDSNPDYLFLAPITAAFWVDIGYIPFIMVVDKNFNPELKKMVFSLTEKQGAMIHNLEHIEGFRTCNVAQLSRLFAAASNYFEDSDYLITDDIDKIPVDFMWFNQQNFSKKIHIFDPDELNYTRLKIGNIGMSSSTWREVIGFNRGSIRDSLALCMNQHLTKDSTWDKAWNLDEWILTNGVFNSQYYPDKCQMIERGGNNLGLRNYRIDRGAWSETYKYCISTKIIDIHIHRKPWEGQVWKDMLTIIKSTFSAEKVNTFVQYREEFLKLI